MPDGQMYSYLQLFLNTEKKKVKLKNGEHCTRLRAAYIHCDTTLIYNEPFKIYFHPT